ncbi:hypothetical protein D3C80_1357380 [compost metagenome]
MPFTSFTSPRSFKSRRLANATPNEGLDELLNKLNPLIPITSLTAVRDLNALSALFITSLVLSKDEPAGRATATAAKPLSSFGINPFGVVTINQIVAAVITARPPNETHLWRTRN